MAERLDDWPLGGHGPWELGLRADPEPEGERPAWRCECGQPKEPRQHRCQRCYLADVHEQQDRIRLLLTMHKPREVAAMLGIKVQRVYESRRRRRR